MHLNIRNEACIPNIIRKGRLDARSFFPRFSFVLSVGVSRKIMRQSIVMNIVDTYAVLSCFSQVFISDLAFA